MMVHDVEYYLVHEMSMMTESMRILESMPAVVETQETGMVVHDVEYYLVHEMSMMTESMRILESMPAVVESQGWWYMM
jgi:hypothetical protein